MDPHTATLYLAVTRAFHISAQIWLGLHNRKAWLCPSRKRKRKVKQGKDAAACPDVHPGQHTLLLIFPARSMASAAVGYSAGAHPDADSQAPPTGSVGPVHREYTVRKCLLRPQVRTARFLLLPPRLLHTSALLCTSYSRVSLIFL